jgi:hypothetical protein
MLKEKKYTVKPVQAVTSIKQSPVEDTKEVKSESIYRSVFDSWFHCSFE